MNGLFYFVRPALTGKWSGRSDYYIPAYMEWFYRIKAVICLLLDLNPPPGKSYYELPGLDLTYTAGGTFSSPGEPTIHWAEALYVGVGVFSNWWTCIYQDSD